MEARRTNSSNYLWISRSQKWKRYNILHTNVGNQTRYRILPHKREAWQRTYLINRSSLLILSLMAHFTSLLKCAVTLIMHFLSLPLSRIRLYLLTVYLIELRCLFWSQPISSELKTSVHPKSLKLVMLLKFYERVLSNMTNVCLWVWDQK